MKRLNPKPQVLFKVSEIDFCNQNTIFIKKKEMSPKRESIALRQRVFIVEDHPVFRDGLVRLLDAKHGLEVCGQAGDYATALAGIKRCKPDIALVDFELPDKSGLELIKKLRALKVAVKLLVVSMYDEALYAERVLRASGDGCIMKEEDLHEIIHAIHDVLAGRIYVSDKVSLPSDRKLKKWLEIS
jgi:DNA-binding NarL/FixJ family response regulator